MRHNGCCGWPVTRPVGRVGENRDAGQNNYIGIGPVRPAAHWNPAGHHDDAPAHGGVAASTPAAAAPAETVAQPAGPPRVPGRSKMGGVS